ARAGGPAPRPLARIFHTIEGAAGGPRRDASWRWTHLVPPHLTGFATGNPMNLALSVAVYASLVRAARLRLDFPGSAAAFGAMTQVVDAEQLAEAAAWSAGAPRAAGRGCSVATGEPPRRASCV